MHLSAPKNVTFYIAVVLGLLGFFGTFVAIPFVSDNAFWFVFIAFALLAVAVLVKDL